MSGIQIAVLCLGISQAATLLLACRVLVRTKPHSWERMVVGEIISINVQRDTSGTRGSVEFRDLAHNVTRFPTQ